MWLLSITSEGDALQQWRWWYKNLPNCEWLNFCLDWTRIESGHSLVYSFPSSDGNCITFNSQLDQSKWVDGEQTLFVPKNKWHHEDEESTFFFKAADNDDNDEDNKEKEVEGAALPKGWATPLMRIPFLKVLLPQEKCSVTMSMSKAAWWQVQQLAKMRWWWSLSQSSTSQRG